VTDLPTSAELAVQRKRIEEIYESYLAHLIRGSRQACSEVVQTLLDESISIRLIYEDLFQRALYRIGSLWEVHEISVATEHLATAITESLMALTYRVMFARNPVHRSAVVACTVNEHHQIGGKMVADLLEMHGWDAYFLGANTPIADLLEMIEDKKPNLVGLSVSVYFSMPGLLDTVAAIRKLYLDLPILIGGQAFRWGGKQLFEDAANITYIASLHSLEEYVLQWESSSRVPG